MSYEDGTQKSRVVVNTPNSRREVRTETTRIPDREGISTGAVAAIVVGAVALVTILFLFLMQNQQDNTNTETPVTAAQPQQQPPIIVQQPAQAPQQPVVVQQPGSSQPVVIQQPAAQTSAPSDGTDDGSIQSNIDRKILEDPSLASLGVIALVVDGKVTLTGNVNSEAMKTRLERLVNSVKGVRSVDNKISIGS